MTTIINLKLSLKKVAIQYYFRDRPETSYKCLIPVIRSLITLLIILAKKTPIAAAIHSVTKPASKLSFSKKKLKAGGKGVDLKLNLNSGSSIAIRKTAS